jgi:hypothetical protein
VPRNPRLQDSIIRDVTAANNIELPTAVAGCALHSDGRGGVSLTSSSYVSVPPESVLIILVCYACMLLCPCGLFEYPIRSWYGSQGDGSRPAVAVVDVVVL